MDALLKELRYWISLRVLLTTEEKAKEEEEPAPMEYILRVAEKRFESLVLRLNLLKDEYFKAILDRVNHSLGVKLDRPLSIEKIEEGISKGSQPPPPWKRPSHWVEFIELLVLTLWHSTTGTYYEIAGTIPLGMIGIEEHLMIEIKP
ncbi:MAG: hypothetical protein ACXAEN_19240, partial [Candidatus Thorarchaeota archaeon]